MNEPIVECVGIDSLIKKNTPIRLIVDEDGGELYENVVDRMTGTRLVIPYSSIKSLLKTMQ